MDIHCMVSTIAWLYVLFRLKRVEILMNPQFSTKKSMLIAIHKHQTLASCAIIIYVIMFVLQRSQEIIVFVFYKESDFEENKPIFLISF